MPLIRILDEGTNDARTLDSDTVTALLRAFLERSGVNTRPDYPVVEIVVLAVQHYISDTKDEE